MIITYFYLVTVQFVNPAGGLERMASAQGVFADADDITESRKLAQALKAAAAQLRIQQPVKGAMETPNLAEFSVLFYHCAPDHRPGRKEKSR